MAAKVGTEVLVTEISRLLQKLDGITHQVYNTTTTLERVLQTAKVQPAATNTIICASWGFESLSKL